MRNIQVKFFRAGIALLVLCLLGACSLGTDINELREKVKGDKHNQSYTVTFNSNGGSDIPDQTVESGGTAARPANPTQSGYAFDNWYSDAGLTTVYDFSTPVTEDITLYAKWNPECTVTFNSNGGSDIPDQIVESGGTATRPANPTRTGYAFDNWYSDAGLTAVYGFSTPVTGDITLHAKWDAVPEGSFTVTFNSNGGSGVPDQMVTAGGKAAGPQGVTYAGHTLDGWYTDNDTFENRWDFNTGAVTGNITLFAKWSANSPNTYTIIFDSNDGEPGEWGQSVLHGDTLTMPAAPTKSGYAFIGWYTDNDTFANVWDFDAPIFESFTLYAKWDLLTYTVTFDINGATGTPPAAITANVGSSITLPDAGTLTRTGYTFGGWNTNEYGTGTNYNGSYTPNGDIILYAWWITLPEMVFVPGGSFEMGKNLGTGYGWDETPVHTVTVTGFYMGKYQVTQAQYQSVMGANPSYFSGVNLPVEDVSWYDAIEFCNALSGMEGLTPYYTINKTEGSDPNNTNEYDPRWLVTRNTSATGYRLPTEAQWEYAAKGGNGSPGNYTYAGSNNPDEVAWYWDSIPSQSSDNSGYGTQPVGTKAPNGLGLYDMSGNVWEWCWDWYGDYPSEAQTNPSGASSGSDRVIRGGSWIHSAELVRSAYRGLNNPNYRADHFGFRLVRP